MGWFGKAGKAELQGHKTVVIHGHRFVIRKVNPLLDFTDENMPQVFSSYQSRRKQAEDKTAGDARKGLDDVAAMIRAGLVEPKLVPELKGEQKGSEDGITVSDIMRDEETSTKLYLEILLHSLNRFRGLKGLFFSARLRRLWWTSLRSVTGNSRTKSPLPQASSV